MIMADPKTAHLRDDIVTKTANSGIDKTTVLDYRLGHIFLVRMRR